MKNFYTDKKRSAWRLLKVPVASLVLMALLGTSFGLGAERAQAQVLGTGVTPTKQLSDVAPGSLLRTVKGVITAASTAISAQAQTAFGIKVFTLDGIAWAIAKLALQQITESTIDWINSGFGGSPAFVQDLGGFLKDSAKKIADEFIYGSALNALCSPFQLNIRIALQLKYANKDVPARCTLSGVVGNVENFLNDFSAGGLPGWFELTVNPNNNFFGASAAAESALFGRLSAKKEIDINKLIFGKGFLGKEECNVAQTNDVAAINAAPDGPQKQANIQAGVYTANKIVCKIVTPGETISASLNKALGTGQDSLVAADQINEVISALFAQLAVQVLRGARGLLGTSDSGGDGRPSYLDQINNPAFDSVAGGNNIGNDIIIDAIDREEEYRDLYASVVSRADALLARIRVLEALDGTETDDGRWECSSFEGVRAQVTAIREPAFVIQSKSDTNLTTLNGLQTRFVTATQNAQYSSVAAEERLDILETFMTLQTSGTLHDESDTIQARFAIEGDAGAPGGLDIGPIVENTIQGKLSRVANQIESICRFIPKPKNDTSSDSGGSE
jgi:hypothetical protein